jgi:hypothetical protein
MNLQTDIVYGPVRSRRLGALARRQSGAGGLGIPSRVFA